MQFLSSKPGHIVNNSLIAGAVILTGINQVVQAETKSIVAVEPLVCDLVSAIKLPSMSVTCLIDRKQDVHDLKFSPKQVRALKNASQVFTLGQEMTPAIKKWLDNPITVVVGVNAIEIDDHDDHDDHSSAKHDDHDDHDDHSSAKHDDHDDHDDHSSAKHDDHDDHDDHSSAKHDDHDDHGDEGGDHHHHDHGGLDPHVWHDPHNIIKMGNVISKNLNKKISFFDRETKKVLKERTQAVNSLLEDLDQWTQRQVSTIPSNQRTIVSKHKAMEYYGDAFGLETISLLDFLGHSSSLRPQTISKVITELREENVQVLFPEQKPPSKLLRNLSRQTSTPIAKQQIFVDGLMPTGNTISVGVHNTCTIVNSLGGSCNKKAGNQLANRWNTLIKR